MKSVTYLEPKKKEVLDKIKTAIELDQKPENDKIVWEAMKSFDALPSIDKYRLMDLAQNPYLFVQWDEKCVQMKTKLGIDLDYPKSAEVILKKALKFTPEKLAEKLAEITGQVMNQREEDSRSSRTVQEKRLAIEDKLDEQLKFRADAEFKEAAAQDMKMLMDNFVVDVKYEVEPDAKLLSKLFFEYPESYQDDFVQRARSDSTLKEKLHKMQERLSSSVVSQESNVAKLSERLAKIIDASSKEEIVAPVMPRDPQDQIAKEAQEHQGRMKDKERKGDERKGDERKGDKKILATRHKDDRHVQHVGGPEKVVSASESKKTETPYVLSAEDEALAASIVGRLRPQIKRDLGLDEARQKDVDLENGPGVGFDSGELLSSLGESVKSGKPLSSKKMEKVSDNLKERAGSDDLKGIDESLKVLFADAEREAEAAKIDLDLEAKWGLARDEMITEAERDIRELNGGNVSAVEDVGEQAKSQVQDNSIKKDGEGLLGASSETESLVKKGGNPLYLKTMKALRKFYKKADRLDAIIFREEYVLPTIDGLIENNKKAGKVSTIQMKEACKELIEKKQELKEGVADPAIQEGLGIETTEQSIDEAFSKSQPKTISAKNAFLKIFADVSTKQNDPQLAASCRWGARSLASKAKRIGKSMVGIKPKKRDTNKNSTPVKSEISR